MAEEIKGVKGDIILQDTLEEIDDTNKKESRKRGKLTAVFPAELVEGMYSHALGQLVHQMNSLFLIFHDKETGSYESFKTQAKKLDSIKGVHTIFCGELENVTHCLKPYSNAALNPKHRIVKAIISEGFKRLRDLGPKLREAKYINNQYVTQFGSEICQFITNFHVVLHKDTPKKDRNRILKEYCDGD
jgi:hypothetical protein